MKDSNVWTIQTKRAKLNDEATSSFILSNGDVLVACSSRYNFFSSELEPIHEIQLTKLADGLERIDQFKHCTDNEDAEFIQLTKIADLQKLKEKGIKHNHDCEERKNIEILFGNFWMTFIKVRTGEEPQIEISSPEENSLVLENIDCPHVLQLSKDK